MAVILLAIIIVPITWGIVSGNKIANKRKEKKNAVELKWQSLNFHSTALVRGKEGQFIFAVNEPGRKVVVVFEDCVHEIPFEQILSVEIIQNGSTVLSKSANIGGAVVGGMLAGGAGMIVGGTSGKTKVGKTLSRIAVRIRLKDLSKPALVIDCFDSKALFGQSEMETEYIKSSYIEECQQHAQKIADLVSIIIDNVERQSSQDLILKTNRPSPCEDRQDYSSMADELKKLADLKDRGILTEEEFKEQKKRLLNQ